MEPPRVAKGGRMKDLGLFQRGTGGMDTTSSVWVELDMSVSLAGGSVLVAVADVESCVKLTKLVADAIESREGRGGVISAEDLEYLSQVQHELLLAAGLLGSRVTSERARTALGAGLVRVGGGGGIRVVP
jgi:hypothetical protein